MTAVTRSYVISDGVTTLYTIPFPYLSTAHVKVAVNGGELVEGIGYTWFSDTQIQLASAATAGAGVLIYRSTPIDGPLVEFQNGAQLTEDELNTATLQLLYITQELETALDRTLQLTDDGFAWDAQGKRLINLGSGTNLSDAVNLGQVLAEIEGAVSGGSSYGVTPLYWEINGDGVKTDFEIPGAELEDPVFYEVVYNSVPKEPYDDFTIIVDVDDPDNSAIRFPSALADGQTGWVILRGYARAASLGNPVTGAQLLDYLKIRMVSEAGVAFTLNKTAHGQTSQGAADVRTTSGAAVTATLRKNTGDPVFDWETGDFFTLTQAGDGAISLALEVGAPAVECPTGYLPVPRAKYCSVTLRCVDADTNTWAVSGDLALSE